jgi:hypothetical protein
MYQLTTCETRLTFVKMNLFLPIKKLTKFIVFIFLNKIEHPLEGNLSVSYSNYYKEKINSDLDLYTMTNFNCLK